MKTNFKRFLMIVESAGFVDSKFIQSKNAVNFAYIVYLKLKALDFTSSEIEHLVKKWLVMSLLTGRYSGSIESMFDEDVKKITDDFPNHLKRVEDEGLPDSFWDVTLVSGLEKSNSNNQFLGVFFASQVRDNDRGFLSKDITVRGLVSERGDLHHIFPKAYLKEKFGSRKDYNQISNLVYTQSEINLAIKDKAPSKYFGEVREQCNSGKSAYGGIASLDSLEENMRQNCIPKSVFEMSLDDYPEFLAQRRRLMAEKIRNYYKNM